MKFKREDGGMPWIHMAQERDKWLAVVNKVMNYMYIPTRYTM